MTNPTNAGRRRYAPRLPVEQRREHLLDATLRVLVREGYANVTIEAIAREAGVTRPVVYSAYDGLEPLLHALLDRTQRRGLASMIQLIEPERLSGPIDVWAVETIGEVIDRVQKDPETWAPILGLTRNAPEVVRERIEATRELLRGYVTDALQAGIERRGGPYLDADVLSHMLIAVAEQMARLALERPEHYTRERLLGALEGLLAEPLLGAQ